MRFFFKRAGYFIAFILLANYASFSASLVSGVHAIKQCEVDSTFQLIESEETLTSTEIKYTKEVKEKEKKPKDKKKNRKPSGKFKETSWVDFVIDAVADTIIIILLK